MRRVVVQAGDSGGVLLLCCVSVCLCALCANAFACGWLLCRRIHATMNVLCSLLYIYLSLSLSVRGS